MLDFGRVVTAMITPFKQDYSLDLEKAAVIARHLEKNGSQGIVVGGTTGESPTLSKSEKVALFETVKGAVLDKTTVLAGTGTNCTRDSVALTKEAEAVGVDGIMAVVPYYNKPSQEGLYQHFKAIAQATRLPVMVYNVPSRTASNLQARTVKRLSEIDNIVAIKEAANDVEQAAEIKKLCGPDFKIYSGNDSFTLPMLSLGGHGVVSVASHIVGSEIGEMISEYLGGNTPRAWEINLKLLPLFKVLFIASNPVPLKKALNLLGFDVGPVRLPLVEMEEAETKVLEQSLKDYGLL
ncbi:MAG: 4-hydroxy-tetrahydrodipicolinate synthase [Bacillota bacterium]